MRSLVTFLLAVLLAGCTLPLALCRTAYSYRYTDPHAAPDAGGDAISAADATANNAKLLWL